MHHKKSITVMIVPHDHKRVMRIRLVGWQVVAGAVLFSISVILFAVGVLLGGRSAKLIAENRSLRVENEHLKGQRVKIAILERELSETSKLRGWMEDMIGAEKRKTEKTFRIASIGGGFDAMGTFPFKPRLTPEFGEAAEDYKARLSYIPRGLPIKGVITAHFGEIGGKFLAPHSGIDLAAPEGTIVKATASGMISRIENDPSLGLVVTVDHLNGYRTRYGHLSAAICYERQWVSAGSKIGYVGSSGHAEGPHVHYQLILDGKPINPEIERGSDVLR